MPIPVRHFLGWEGPLVRRVASWMWDEIGPRDLRRCLVITPTAHSGRRLREAMAEVAGGGLLAPRFGTPDSLFRPGPEAAPKAVLAAAWARVLLDADPARLAPLVPEESLADRDSTWAMALADLVMPAVDRLAESALRPRDVAGATQSFTALGAGDGEAERWHAISSLEAEVGGILAGMRLLIPAEAKIRRAQSPQLPPGIDRLVFAAVPDPVPLACHAAGRLLEAGSARIDVLVDAPPAMESWFDPWGRPVSESWKREPIPLPGGNDAITITTDDEAAAKAAVAACAATGSNRIALCVPDSTLVPAIERAFLDAGWPVFDPEGRVAGRSGLLVFLDAQLAVLASPRPTFESANALLRCPEAAIWLDFRRTHAVSRALDRLHAASLPESLDDAMRVLKRWAAVDESARDGLRMRGDSGLLLPLFHKLAACADDARRHGLENVLSHAFDVLAGAGYDDGAGGALLAGLADSLGSLAMAADAAPKLGSAALAECWRKSLPDTRAETNRPAASLDALGWLESPYEAAPHLVVAGMHHGCVPDGVREDAFLPDSLRAALGLRTQSTRDARDAFLLRAMVEARGEGGSVRVIVSKFDGVGEPRKPSALLLLCGADELAARVLHVFREFRSEDAPVRPARSRGPWLLSFPRDPEREQKELGVIHPTLVKNYLRCPVRFYLQFVLGMKHYDPDQKELAATEFGSLVHGVLEAFGRDESMRGCGEAGNIADYLDAELDRQVAERFGVSHSLPLMVQIASARDRLQRFAEWQAQDFADGWRIHDIEFRVGRQDNLKWTIGGLPVAMKIDRIDWNEKDKKWRVLDYKTSAKAMEPKKTHLKPCSPGDWHCGPLVEPTGKEKGQRKWVDVQLPLYAAYWRHHLGDEGAAATIETAYMNLPSALADTGCYAWPGHTKAIEDMAIACTEAVAANIRQGIFWPPSPEVDEEEWDVFRSLADGDLKAALDAATRAGFNPGKEDAQ